MCTVTFLPQGTDFVLTHNRDEAPARSQQTLSRVRLGDAEVLMPRDSGAGGTWIALSSAGYTVCLLNGAFIKHRHEPPYRRSRGMVLLDFLEQEATGAWQWFCTTYDLSDIEPFTFLFFDGERIGELRWDGSQKHTRVLAPDECHFWCSATLYPPEIQQQRETIFRQWLGRRNLKGRLEYLARKVLHLHHTGSVGDPENDYIMNRNGRVQTVSITQIRRSGPRWTMLYEELLSGRKSRGNITPEKRNHNIV
jgi:hypothetical protein